VVFVADVDPDGGGESAGLGRATPLAPGGVPARSAPPPTRTIWPGRRAPAPGGQVRTAGPLAAQLRGVLPALGEDLGVPGAAQGPAGGRGPGARPALCGCGGAAAVVGRGPARLRRGRRVDAPPGGAARAAGAGRPTAQARSGWAA